MNDENGEPDKTQENRSACERPGKTLKAKRRRTYKDCSSVFEFRSASRHGVCFFGVWGGNVGCFVSSVKDCESRFGRAGLIPPFRKRRCF